jgi:hypothetical protein
MRRFEAHCRKSDLFHRVSLIVGSEIDFKIIFVDR